MSSFIEAARRAQIIEATVAVIADLGYGGASIARIAERAGISVGLVSYHFGSKDELIRQVVAHLGARLEAAIEAETDGAPSYTAALRGLIESHVRFTGGNTVEAAALSQIYTSGIDASPVRPTEGERRGWIAEFEQMVREGQDEGEFRECDPYPVAVTLLAALESSPAELRSRPDVDVDSYARELADFFEASLVGHQKRGRTRAR